MVPKIPIEKELSLLYPLFPSLFSSLEFFVVTRSHLYFCNLWKVLACAETHGTAADEWFFSWNAENAWNAAKMPLLSGENPVTRFVDKTPL